MAIAEDIARIIEQERRLEFSAFDESTAFSILSRVRERGLAQGWPIVCDIRLWDRQIAFVTLPGASGDNANWALRKSNTVRRLGKSSYRAKLEVDPTERMFPPHRNMPVNEFAFSGGGFPIRVKGAGIIGSIAVSGLPERDDHESIVAAVATELGIDAASLALAPAGR